MGDRLFKEYFEGTGYELSNEQSAQVNSNNHLSVKLARVFGKIFYDRIQKDVNWSTLP